MEITDVTTVIGYLNSMQAAVSSGYGNNNDLYLTLTTETALASNQRPTLPLPTCTHVTAPLLLTPITGCPHRLTITTTATGIPFSRCPPARAPTAR